MWFLEYYLETGYDDEELFKPYNHIITRKCSYKDKLLFKKHVADILSMELDNNGNAIDPNIDSVKKYNLYGNALDKIDHVLKFFKKNYERYQDIVKQTNDFENTTEFKYDIVEQCDMFYTDRLFNTTKEKFIKSYIIIKKEENKNGM